MLNLGLPLEGPQAESVPADILPIVPRPPVVEAPKGSIQSRSVFPDPGYVEWALPNGATVVHKPIPTAEGAWLLGFGASTSAESAVFAGGAYQLRDEVYTGTLGNERLVVARAPALNDALASVADLFGEGDVAAAGPRPWSLVLGGGPPASAEETGALPAPFRPVERRVREPFGAFTFVVVSSDAPERVEALVGRLLGTLTSRPGEAADATAVSPRAEDAGRAESLSAVVRLQTYGARRDAPALDVLASAVRQRLGGAAVFAHAHPLTEVLRLEAARSGAEGAALRDGVGDWLAPFSEAEVRDARTRAAASVRAGDPAVWAGLLADLYRESGPFRPARNPAELSQYADRLAAVSTASVNALAARLRSSASTSLSR